MLIAPKGTGKATYFANLLRHPKSKLLTDDIAFVRLNSKEAIADAPERKLYMQTNFVEKYPDLAPLFDKSKCENVVTSRDQCTTAPASGSTTAVSTAGRRSATRPPRPRAPCSIHTGSTVRPSIPSAHR